MGKVLQNSYYIYKISSDKISHLSHYSFKEASRDGNVVSIGDNLVLAKIREYYNNTEDHVSLYNRVQAIRKEMKEIRKLPTSTDNINKIKKLQSQLDDMLFVDDIVNIKVMTKKEKEVTVSKSLLDRVLAKCGYAKIEDVPAVALELTTAGGDVLTVEREEGEPQVGDSASPDGEHVMPDGKTIVVTDGVITEIREAEEGNDETAALEARIAELEQQVSDLTANAKTEDEINILAAVEKAGGIEKLTKAAASKYIPSGRAPQVKGKPAGEKESKIEKKLAAFYEKNKQRFNK